MVTQTQEYMENEAPVYMPRGKISTKKEIRDIGPRPPQRSFD
jgi:hypothetical protein